ncbi:MAG: hypothetical protein U0636_00120 [Phycisphaerales bacterium]
MLVLDVAVSPYDVPDAVRAFRTAVGKLRIEFKYVDGDESSHDVRVDDFIVVTEGRRSNRVIAIEIDTANVPLPPPLSVSIRPTAIPESMARVLRLVETVQSVAPDNRQVIGAVLRSKQDDLLRHLAPA